MNTTSENDDHVEIVVVTGRLDAFAATDVRARLSGKIDAGNTRLILDLSAVEHIDSAGLAALVWALKQCRQANGDVRLVRPATDAANRVFGLTKFDLVFTMADSADMLTNDW
jgi:anti-sigma B factor antagonist